MEDWKTTDADWKLLGRARHVSVSPYFSRRVLRAVRTESTSRPPAFTEFLFRWIAGAALAVITVGFFTSAIISQPEVITTQSPEFIEAFDRAAGLDLVVSSVSPTFTVDSIY